MSRNSLKELKSTSQKVLLPNEIELKANENTKYVKHCLDLFNYPAPKDFTNVDEVFGCIQNYFQSCINNNIRPGNLGLYNALGFGKKDFDYFCNGKLKDKKMSKEVYEIVKRAKLLCGTYRESLANDGHINPATLIFWQKNYDSLKDIQENDITIKTESQDLTREEIEKQISEDIPDADYTELAIEQNDKE